MKQHEFAVALLERCKQTIQDRGEDYGTPRENFSNIARFWTAYDHKKQTYGVTDVGVMMMLVKIARIMESPHKLDHWEDIAGYAAVTAAVVCDTEDNQHLLMGQQNIEPKKQGCRCGGQSPVK